MEEMINGLSQREYHKQWRARHREKLREKGRKDYQKFKEYHQKRQKSEEYKRSDKRCKMEKDYHKKYYQENKGKFKERDNQVLEIVKQSRHYAKNHFKKLDKCYFCSKNEDLMFHHLVYRVPLKREDVITICRGCHKKLHYFIDFDRKAQAKEIINQFYGACQLSVSHGVICPNFEIIRKLKNKYLGGRKW